MSYAVAATGLLLHVLFWGAGLALLATPRVWRKFWAVFAAPCGLALQSAVVWAGAHTDLAGTNSYALASELVPAALLAFALWRDETKEFFPGVRRLAGVGLAMVVSLGAMTWALSRASHGLTTVSLGSCDAADYAAGARVLQEFSRNERGGFIGLVEVVSVQSVDNFFDYWTRLNHFTPAALIAFNSAVLGYEPWKITGLMTAVLVALSLPLVFWVARALLGLRGAAGVFVALLYGLSPVTWYAVGHVAPGQLLAAQGIALVTWVGFAAWRRPSWALAGVLGVAYWLLLGSYNFIVLGCLAPAAMGALGAAARGGEWRRLGRWCAVMLAPLAGCAVIFWERAAGLAERLTLLREFDFGWRIPMLTPEGILGFVSDVTLAAEAAPGRWAACLIILLALGWALRGRRVAAWRAGCLVAPAVVGYLYLQWRGAALGTNASYDAYKVLAVFFPGVLAVACAWLLLLWRREGVAWVVAVVLGVAVLGAHVRAVSLFAEALQSPPLRVTRELRDVQKLEAMPEVTSLNMRIPEMWSRLWANGLLLRKPQYFLTDTYEARWHTPLRGEWDLQGGLVKVRLPGDATKEAGAGFWANDTRSAGFMRAEIGEGWNAEETLAATGERWRWTKGEATLRVENPHAQPLRVVCVLDARSVAEREISVNGSTTVRVGAGRAKVRLPMIKIPPGGSVIALKSPQATARIAGDGRELGVCVWGVELMVQTP